MINYIGQFKREKINTVIRAAIRRNKNIYTFLLFLPAIIYLLFYKGIIKAPEKISGDKQATALLINGMDENGNWMTKGTAFLVSDKGILLTARHCVEEIFFDDETVLISFNKIDDRKFQNLKAKVIYLPEDEEDDYAVLKLVNKLPNSPKIKPLDVAGEIKNPNDYNPELIIIGYKGKDITQTYDQTNQVRNYSLDDETIFETDEIFQGMSGGPVIDKESGKVIGIVSKKKTLVSRDGYGNAVLQDDEGLSYHEKIQQVFNDPNASHIDW
tara:strand:- start:1621 stop:2430 length:810 start_codon:yes stop_codon:yes gene_type:complete